jgi:hypothetical protein
MLLRLHQVQKSRISLCGKNSPVGISEITRLIVAKFEKLSKDTGHFHLRPSVPQMKIKQGSGTLTP